ncbi:MAG: mandelate racemase/muconate lactonizing enzyme family protein [Castellaniella sp.]|uniref:mandelate racemase/muconate lactonizing enzyme family protein n=1 Tax=Castellaniella sp. TaxID=1955812 RepID=UPI0012144E68|nr:mandelate racemase/muconate lactonizing enzyme family protein [Castellaniella sp.]TAN25887.1 MAG: mandelate racemase/muconate lactonizing enzyme family protein [Castellaniella sp.]
MPTIATIETCAPAVPLDKITSFSNRTVSERHYGLVKIRSTDGVEGIGFCYVGTSGGAIFTKIVKDLFKPLLLGADSYATEAHWAAMYQEALLQGRAGTAMRALSALDIAMWDLNARTHGVPLHKYLGAMDLNEVPAYASGGYYLDGKSPNDLAKEMTDYVALGFKAVKMKSGRLSPAEEEIRLRTVREAVGPDIDIMMDMNNAWSDTTQAMRYVRRFEAYDPYFFEEPFLPDDIDNHARLAKLTRVPIATGEIGYGRWYHKALMEKGGASILQTDAAVCGGITEWRRIAQTAASNGLVMLPHWFHDLHAPLVASMPNAHFVEFFANDQVLNFRKLLDRQLSFKNGKIQLHQEPGLGFGFDEASLAKLARWE